MLNEIGVKALDAIRADLMSWDQGFYACSALMRTEFYEAAPELCRTTYCYAGHVLLAAGYTPVWAADRWLVEWVHTDGSLPPVPLGMEFDTATMLLGWQFAQADEVFHAMRFSDRYLPVYDSREAMFATFERFVHGVASSGR